MSEKEAHRLGIMKMLVKEDLTLRRASEELGLFLKQTRRVWKRFLKEVAKGLISRKRGQPCNHCIPLKRQKKIMNIMRNKYPDFGPTLAAEKLRERNHQFVSVETLRQWMIQEDSGRPRKKESSGSTKGEQGEAVLES